MNTDDNEKLLAQKAMIPPGEYTKAVEAVNRFHNRLVRLGYVSPPVNRVKGFDDNAQRAAHKKRQRAKAHQRKMRRNPSHV